MNLNDMDLAVHNYEKLTDGQRPILPADLYNFAEMYLKIKRDLAKKKKRNSNEQLQNKSKS